MLFIIFIVLLILKLAAVITWSWWIIFIPLYLPLAMFAFAAVMWIITVVSLAR